MHVTSRFSLKYQEYYYKKGERECLLVCKHPLKRYRGQLVQYYTYNALIYPRMTGLVTTTTATDVVQHCKGVRYCGHTP